MDTDQETMSESVYVGVDLAKAFHQVAVVVSLPFSPSALSQLRLRFAEYSIVKCSKSSFPPSLLPSHPTSAWFLRTSPYVTRSKYCCEMPSGPD